MKRKIYLEDTYQFNCESIILDSGQDDKGCFIVCDQSVFYPQGGGQPSDRGVIKNDSFSVHVEKVSEMSGEIKHYITEALNDIPIGSQVQCFVDRERRLVNARYHTAAHLLGNIVESLYPKMKAVKGHSFSGEAYVEFDGESLINLIEIQTVVQLSIDQNHKTNIFEIDRIDFEQQFYTLTYTINDNKKFRVMQIGNMSPVPCGGTHVSSLNEIGMIAIKKIRASKDRVRISYEVL